MQLAILSTKFFCPNFKLTWKLPALSALIEPIKRAASVVPELINNCNLISSAVTDKTLFFYSL